MLAFKWLLNLLNPRSMKNVMVVLPKLCRMDHNWPTCVLAPSWEPYCGNRVLCCKWNFLGTS